MTKTLDQIEDQIYKILFDKSTVDAVRIIHEDEWPIEELASLVKEYAESVALEVISENYDCPCEERVCPIRRINEIKDEQRAKLKEILKDTQPNSG